MESEPMITPKEKSPPPEPQRRFEPRTLHHAGQRAQYTSYQLNHSAPSPPPTTFQEQQSFCRNRILWIDMYPANVHNGEESCKKFHFCLKECKEINLFSARKSMFNLRKDSLVCQRHVYYNINACQFLYHVTFIDLAHYKPV